MRLAEFITDNMELILMEWETFAASVLPATDVGTPASMAGEPAVSR